MTHVEQHGMIVELSDFTRRMSRSEADEFDMFVRRDKDDEDLDLASKQKLLALYRKYIPKGKYLL